MLQWKRLMAMEQFESECLPKIVAAAFGKMEFKSTLDLPDLLGSYQKRRNEENFQFTKKLKHEE